MGLPLYFASLRQTEVGTLDVQCPSPSPTGAIAEQQRGLQAFLSTPFARGCTTFCIDTELVYEPFCADFGPLNLGNTFRFCQKLSALLKVRGRRSPRHAHAAICLC